MHITDSGVYQSFFEHHRDAVYILDLNGQFIDANPAALQLTGYSKEQFLTLGFRDIIRADLIPQSKHYFAEVCKGQSQAFETTLVTRDLHHVEIQVTATPILIDGEVVGVFSMVRDMTLEKLNERTLKERHQRYESLKRYNPNGICSFDLTGRVVGANPAYERITGYTVEELRELDVFQTIIDPSIREAFTRGQLAENVETKIIHKNGNHVDVRVTTVPIVIENELIGMYAILEDVTKQKRDRKRLQEINEIFRLISENSQDFIAYSSPDGITRYVSPSIENLLGYKPEEIIGQSNSAYYHPDDLDYVSSIGARILRGEDVPRFTCRILAKSGNYLWYETTLKILRNEDGSVQQVIGVGRDVSEQMKLQESLEHALRIAKLGHWEWHVPGGKLQVASHLYEMFGVSSAVGEKLTIEQCLKFIHPQERELVQQSIERALQTGSPFDRIFRVLLPDESVKYVHIQGEILLDDAGNPIVVVGTARDITDEKVSELELYQTKERYRQLVENSLDAIGIIDCQSNCWAFMNQAGLQLFGAETESEILGRSIFSFLHPDHHEESKDRLGAVMAGYPLNVVERKWQKVNGDIVYTEIQGVPFDKHALQLIIRDVTKRKQAEEAIVRSEKLTAVGQLAAGVAHEIRNPLTALKGFVQILHGQATEENDRYFHIMRAELDRIELILREMLVLAKPQAVTFNPEPVSELMNEVTFLLSAQAAMKNVVIQGQFHESETRVLCDRNQLKQVFVNIIKNGIEAMPHGGNISIHIGDEDGNVRIEIVDEGDGIPEEQLPKLGNPFFTTKEKGTGLGLMMCERIITNHQGAMSFSSVVGKGTRVTLLLPAYR